MSEDYLRRERLHSFWLSTLVAFGPYLIAVAWHFTDQPGFDVLFRGIPDIALAGVVIAVAGYSNTIFSFTKLNGWQGPGRWTYLVSIIVAILTINSSVQYLKAVYAPQQTHNLSVLFYAALISTFTTGMFTWVLQHTFVSDECRQARDLVSRLPRRKK
jgi:hypothetical protein